MPVGCVGAAQQMRVRSNRQDSQTELPADSTDGVCVTSREHCHAVRVHNLRIAEQW